MVMEENLEEHNSSNDKDNVTENNWEEGLRTHLKTTNGEKSNKCNQCNYSTAYASALRTHLKKHSGEKSNKCNQCDYASSDAGNLWAHLKHT